MESVTTNSVYELLQKHGITATSSGRDWLTYCLNPDHDDSNPSFRIDKTSGIAHCFSCGFKTNIFKHFGITSTPHSVKIAKLKEKLNNLNISLNGVVFPDRMIPYTKPFRGISAATLKTFGAFCVVTGDDKFQNRIWFPIKDLRDRNVVFVGRHMMSSENPKYLIYPSKTTIPIFPERFTEKHKSVILVEGIFDMLNLYDKGLKNVVCSFGTNTLQNDTALKLLALKTQGIEKIYFMFDGDDAGQQAVEKLEPLVQEAGFKTDKIVLGEDTDPGELTQEYINSIKDWISEKDLHN